MMAETRTILLSEKIYKKKMKEVQITKMFCSKLLWLLGPNRLEPAKGSEGQKISSPLVILQRLICFQSKISNSNSEKQHKTLLDLGMNKCIKVLLLSNKITRKIHFLNCPSTQISLKLERLSPTLLTCKP